MVQLTEWSQRSARACRSAPSASPARLASCISSRCSPGPPPSAWPRPSSPASYAPVPLQRASYTHQTKRHTSGMSDNGCRSLNTRANDYFCDFLLGHVVPLSLVALFWRRGSFLLPVLSVWGGRVGVTLPVVPVRWPWAASLLASCVVGGSCELVMSASRELRKSRLKYLDPNGSSLPKTWLILQPKGRQWIGSCQTWRP